MLTKNGIKMIANYFSPVMIPFTDTGGATVKSFSLKSVNQVFYLLRYVSSDTDEYGIALLESAPEPSVEEYYAPGKTSSDISCVYLNTYISSFDDHVEIQAAYNVTNNRTETFTISHIYYTGSSTIYSEGPHVLIDHTKLETPIEIPAGESKTVTYKFRINYYTA